MDTAGKTQRIAKNTILLYVRMMVTMVITLFTSRIVLQALGFDDYGLYNVISGVVTLFAFLRSSMSSSTQRFLSYEMGSGTADSLRRVFSMCLTTHLLLALILLVLAETVGLWFMNSYINIPEGREAAANWVYQFGVLSLCLNMVSLPYEGDIVSNERMGYFAFLNILEAVLKLAIAYCVLYAGGDHLILYGGLMIGISALNLLLNWIYCRAKFAETRYFFFWDKQLFKQIFSFSGWTIYGELAVVGSNQGTNIIVNIFHTVAANAAMGVGHQVKHALQGLVSNILTAVKPQISKSYAAGHYTYMVLLTNIASKISFLLLLVVSLPIMLNIDLVLELWLGDVPAHASELCIIFIIASLCNAISLPLYITILATGHIKGCQITVSVCYLMELLVIYVLFSLGVPLVMGVAMKAVLNAVMIFVYLYFVRRVMPSFSAGAFVRQVLFPMLVVALVSWGLSLSLVRFTDTLALRIVATFVGFVFSIAIAFFVGLRKTERVSLRKLFFKRR